MSKHNRLRRLNFLQFEDRVTPSTNYTPPTFFLIDPIQLNTAASRQDPEQIARGFLTTHAVDFHATAADFDDATLTSYYTDADTGISHVYLRQNVRGLDVAYADMNVTIASDGRVIAAGGGFVPNLATTLDITAATPVRSAVDAVDAAQVSLMADSPVLSDIAGPVRLNSVVSTMNTKLRDSVIASPISSVPVTAHLQFAPTADGSAVLTWNLNIQTPNGLHWYDMHVADSTGEVVAVSDWVDNDSYNSVPLPNESPQDGGLAILADPASTAASPFGWHDTNGVAGAEFTDTRGNNVDAHLDRNADNVADPSPGRPSGGASVDFSNYAFDASQSPTVLANQNAAQVNLFYLNNYLHDVHYAYGFTPVAGNFQTNNYGLGGSGNDAVQADAQDGSGTNNANFGTPVDGSAPRMQQFIFTTTTPNRDSDLDNGVVIHEYGHGVSNRLTGGPANSSALNNVMSGGMGEGWSDFFALMLTQVPSDTQNAAFPIGTYVLGQNQNTGAGIRRFPYSFNMTVDPLTYDAYGSSGATPYGVNRSAEVHNAGEIWCTTLWDINWLLMNKYGYDSNLTSGWSTAPGEGHAGNKLALRLVEDAMKLQPANPSFTQARDAIIAADNALNGGADLLQIWQAFARRGLGSGVATVANSSSTAAFTVDSTVPATAQVLQVTGSTPAALSILASAPTSFTLTVTEALTAATVQAADFIVNGIAATSVAYTAGGTSVTFSYTSSPVTAQGLQTMQIAAGAFTRASDAGAVQAYASSFRFDSLKLAVASTTPVAGGIATVPLFTFDINLNEAVLPASVSTNDIVLTQGYATAVTLINGNQTIRYTLTGLAVEGNFSATLRAGAITDANGNPNAGFTGTYSLDASTRAFTTPLSPLNPRGSLIFTGTMTGLINSSTDTDDFTLALDAGQGLSIVVVPGTGLQPRVQIFSPTNAVLADFTASAVGNVATVFAPASVIAGGTYTIRVAAGAATVGSYTVKAYLNAQLEAENLLGGTGNNTPATAESLNPSATATTGAITLATSTRRTIVGTVDPVPGGGFTTSSPTYDFEDIAGSGTTILTSQDDAVAAVPIGFSFNYYGTSYTSLFANTNGLLTFGTTGLNSYDNTDLSTSPTQPAIAAFWDDLFTTATGVKYETRGTGTSRRLIVQWQNLRYYDGTATTLQFQATLYEATGQILINYTNLTTGTSGHDEGISATVGLTNGAGNFLTLLANNGPVTAVGSGKSVLFSPSVPTADYYTFSGTLGQSVSLALDNVTAGSLGVTLLSTNGSTVLGTGIAATNLASSLSNIVLPATGTYYVNVNGTPGTQYTLSVATNALFDAEANDTAATAQSLGTARVADGYLDASTDDWFTITLPAGSSILRLETNTPGDGVNEPVNTLDPTLRLYNVAGTTLLGTGSTLADGHNDGLTLTGLTPGTTYAIRVSGNGTTSGEYVLSGATIAPVTPAVQSIVVNGGATQRSRLTTLAVNFNTPVSLAATAFTLTRPAFGTTSPTPATLVSGTPTTGQGKIVVALNPSGTVATLTFTSSTGTASGDGVDFNSLSDGSWQLTVTGAGVVNLVGTPMTADFLTDNTPGTTYSQTGRLYRLFGDNDGDADVDTINAAQFRQTFGSLATTPNGPPVYNMAFDFDNDGDVDTLDSARFRQRFGQTV